MKRNGVLFYNDGSCASHYLSSVFIIPYDKKPEEYDVALKLLISVLKSRQFIKKIKKLFPK